MSDTPILVPHDPPIVQPPLPTEAAAPPAPPEPAAPSFKDLGILPDCGKVLSIVQPAQARHVRAAYRAHAKSGGKREISDDYLARSLCRIDGQELPDLDDLAADDYLAILGAIGQIQASLDPLAADRRRTIQHDGVFYSAIGTLPASGREVAKMSRITAKITRDARARANGEIYALVENVVLAAYLIDGQPIDPILLTTTLDARDYLALYAAAGQGSGKGLSPLPNTSSS